MTALQGTHEFSSSESRNIEKEIKDIISNIVTSWGDKWELKKNISFSDVFIDNEIAFNERGQPTTFEPDGGMLFHYSKPVALFEVKHQKAKANACERVFKYLPIIQHLKIKNKNFFVFLDGQAFQKNNRGHITSQPGATALLLKSFGSTLFINNNTEETKKLLISKLDNMRIEIESERNNMENL